MDEKVPCKTCDVEILLSTAQRNNGLCMPCKNNTRKKMDEAKELRKRERELDKTCPFRALWRGLVDKVHRQSGGFSALSEEEKIYFAVNLLEGEVYNGGFDQYFYNSSGEYYRYSELGLMRIGATKSLKLLREAKTQLFGSMKVPKDRKVRWEILQQKNIVPAINNLDAQFCKDEDKVGDKLENFAIEVGLVIVAPPL